MCAKRLMFWIASVVTLALAAHASSLRAADPPTPLVRPYKILHIMSYHSPWRWTDGQLAGFKEGMRGLPAEYKVFQMDTKRNSTPEAKEKMGREARALITQWKPDLVYTSDDDAQEYVAGHYVNTDIPFVFSGVNKDPKAYGFVGSRNNTGVMEQEHFVESVQLLKKLVPGVKKIAVVFDDAAMWAPVQDRMRAAAKAIPDIQFGPWDTILDFDEFKSKVRDYHGKADAIALIGIFNFKDGQGRNVPYQDVLKWVAENSTLPDFGFWIDRIYYGTLCTVTVSEREQGLEAGRMARAILADGTSPATIPMKPTVKGLPVINLARAHKLGLRPTTGVLLSAEIIQKFVWDKQ